jgi:glycerol-3-phosphate dehydrogenase
VDYLVANEWARTAQDVLWRRTKIGLRVSKEEAARLEDYLAQRG